MPRIDFSKPQYAMAVTSSNVTGTGGYGGDWSDMRVTQGVTPYRNLDYRDWSNTPNYLAQKREGTLSPRLLIREKGVYGGVVIAQSKGRVITDNSYSGRVIDRSRYTWDLPAVMGSYPRHHQGTIVSNDDVYLKARLALDDTSAWNPAPGLLDLNKTVKMVTGVATAVVVAAREVRRGRLGNAWATLTTANLNQARWRQLAHSHHSRTYSPRWGLRANEAWKRDDVRDVLADRTLMWNFGFKPLMSDVQDAVRYIHNAWHGKWQTGDWCTLRVSKGAGRTEALGKGGYPFHESPFHLSCGATIVSRENVKLIGHYRLVDPTLRDLADLGILNPLPTLWEVTMLSDVVDWFIPVGDYFDSLDSTTGLQFRSVEVGRKIVSNVQFYDCEVEEDDVEAFIDGYAEHIYVERQVIEGGIPQVLPLNLHGKSAVHGSQLASGAALLWNLAKGFRK